MSKAFQPGGHLSGTKSVQFYTEALQTIRSFDWPWASYSAIYRKQPSVRTVVDFLARGIAQLNPKVYRRISNDDRQEINDHPVARLLRQPNPRTTRYALLRDLVSDLAIFDRAYWVKIRVNGQLRALGRIPPMNLVREERGWRDSAGRTYTRDDLVIFTGYNPDGNDDGVSQMETLRRTLAEEWNAIGHREGTWRNGARVGGWIERPVDAPPWDDSSRERFRSGLQSTLAGGENAGKVGVLEDGMKFNASAWSPKDSEYIEGRKLTRVEACLAFGVDPMLLGLGDTANANLESRHRHLYQDTFGPYLRFFQDEFDLQLLEGEDGVYTEFNLAEKLKGSFEEQQKALVTSVGVPFLTVNEGRSILNKPRIDDEAFDLPVQPMNVLYGGQPAVTVPTEVPEAAALEDILRKFFTEQEHDVRGAMGRTPKVEDWPWDRWDAKLATLLDCRMSVAKQINDNTREALKKGAPIQAVFADATNGRAAHLAGVLGGQR